MKKLKSDRLTVVDIFDRMCGVLGFIAGVVIVVLTLLVAAGVVARYIFREPFPWGVEVAMYLMLGSIFLAVAYSERENAHVRVEILVSYLPPKGQAIMNIFARLVGLAYCAVLTWKGVEMTVTAYLQSWISPELLAFPLWISMWVLPVGGFVLCLQLVANISRYVGQLTHEGQPVGSH
ncbi:TRAP transporter small permease subunit [Chloroflexota bacterium]